MNEQDVLEGLERATDALLCVRVGLGGLPGDLPDVALDAALGADDDYQRSRKEMAQQVEKVLALVGPFDRDAVLGLESAVNNLVTCGVVVGWRLGLMASQGHLGASGGELAGHDQ
jgi:hypothetical protein